MTQDTFTFTLELEHNASLEWHSHGNLSAYRCEQSIERSLTEISNARIMNIKMTGSVRINGKDYDELSARVFNHIWNKGTPEIYYKERGESDWITKKAKEKLAEMFDATILKLYNDNIEQERVRERFLFITRAANKIKESRDELLKMEEKLLDMTK